MRITELARVLAREHEVVLAGPRGSEAVEGLPEPITFTWAQQRDLVRAARRADAVIAPPVPADFVGRAQTRSTRWTVDLLCPNHFEALEMTGEMGRLRRWIELKYCLDQQTAALLYGDFFICGSERQRDMWLGGLMAKGRTDPSHYDVDPTLRSLIDVVPIGIPSKPCEADEGALKGRVPGIGEDSKVVLWGGGLWDWLDPLTAIRAMERLKESRTDIRLFFMGTVRPGREQSMSMSQKALELSRELGLEGTAVFFNDSWVPYARRAAYFKDGDAALSIDFDHVETHYSFRTRILDSIWGGLPLISTPGDTLSERMAAEGVARIIDYGDSEALARSMVEVVDADKESFAPGFAKLREQLTWERVAEPVLNYLARSETAPVNRRSFAHISIPYRAAHAYRIARNRVRRSTTSSG